MPDALTLDDLKRAVAGSAAAFRCIAEYQPAGGVGDKIFPPTYEGGKYAIESRVIDGVPTSELIVEADDRGREARTTTTKSPPRTCVLLDSVQSQANRMEQALLERWERGDFPLPVLTVDFVKCELPKPLRITSLEAPHRIADALIRDSLLDGTPFRKSEVGRRLDEVSNREATALFELCPTALVFGLWDSTGPKGGLGAKFARALVSEIIGIDAEVGVRTSSRIDPAQVMLQAGPLFRAENELWTLDEQHAVRDKKKNPIKLGKDGKPSEANHGNVTPTIARGGVTISRAVQTTVLSLPALRRLRFPLDGKAQARTRPEVDDAGRTALAALALCAAALNQAQGCDLRSRCQLHPTTPFTWEMLDEPGAEPRQFTLRPDQAVAIYREAVEEAKAAGLPWRDEELVLEPSPQLADLVLKSQALAAEQPGDEGDSD